MLTTTRIREAYVILAETYPLFADIDDEWRENGLLATPFRTLVSVALSTMTNGPRTLTAAVGLLERAGTLEELRNLDDDVLRDAIRSVAHYNRKTISLKEMSRRILDEHGGVIPRDRDELMRLPGIGRKCADIMMSVHFGAPTIAVDTHVHRVVNRIGIVDTATRVQTADALERATPDEFRQHAHEWLIQHGMQVCVARVPRCGQCPLAGICELARSRAVGGALPG